MNQVLGRPSLRRTRSMYPSDDGRVHLSDGAGLRPPLQPRHRNLSVLEPTEVMRRASTVKRTVAPLTHEGNLCDELSLFQQIHEEEREQEIEKISSPQCLVREIDNVLLTGRREEDEVCILVFLDS